MSPQQSISSARQPGAAPVEIANGTILHASVIKQNGALWGVHTVLRAGHAALHWFQVDAATNTIRQDGYIEDPQRDLFYGSIAVNKFEDVVIGFSGSSETEFISTYAVAGTTTGGATTFGPPMLLKAGVASYFQDFGSGRNRWGDYSATVVDPSDSNTFWTIQEFVSSQNRWSTQVTELRFPRGELVNDRVSFVADPATFSTTIDTTGCQEGAVGRFDFTADLQNIGSADLTHLTVGIADLTDGNLIMNADYGPRGAGGAITIPKTDGLIDGVLTPGERVVVPFGVCLQELKPFNLFVDVFGRE